jgi:secreted PhoX family phosphatase
MKMFKVKLSIFAFLSLAVVMALAAPTLVHAQDSQPLVPLTDPYAPFLESRAYAASKGATAEFNKMEWVALDPAKNKLYLAMSDVAKSMSDGEGAIKVEENRCGIVYVADLDKDYNTTSLKPLIVGGPYNKDGKPDRCDASNISNPDSLFVDPYGNLWIGEDTSNHQNNALWRWDGKALLRYATLPTGAEVTGVFVTQNGDLIFSVQHPSAMSQYPFNRGAVVIINGFKSNATFKSVPVPTGDAIHTLTIAAGKYQVISRAGELIPNDIYGQRFGQINRLDNTLQLVCNHPDGNVFLPVNAKGTEGYLFTNYECRPGNVSKLYLRQNGQTWEVLEGENVDFANVMGTWNNCGSSVTPWNTALTAEEYEPFAPADSWQGNVVEMTDYLGEQANPYDYGYLVEMTPDPSGDYVSPIVEKHYAMGRFSHEMGLVMPDQKTVYHGDDGANVVLFKFVADEAGVLSAGTLYAAKVEQQADESFKLTWIELGKGNDEDIAAAIAAIKLP